MTQLPPNKTIATIPPNMTVNHSLQAALDWGCNRGRYLGGWHAASDSVRRGVLALHHMSRVKVGTEIKSAPSLQSAADLPPAVPSQSATGWPAAGRGGLHAGGKRMLALLRERGPLTIPELAEPLQILASSVSITISRLESRGWVVADKPKHCWGRRFKVVASLLFFALSLLAAPAANVTLAWDASPDETVVGYRIYWGPATGNYTNSLTLSNVLTATLTNLTAGATYYLAATAFDAEGLESVFSNEIHWNGSPSIRFKIRAVRTRTFRQG